MRFAFLASFVVLAACSDGNPCAAVPYYLDADGDGFGDAAHVRRSCEAPAGYVETGTDCNDADDTAFPGAAEGCDGRDHDCDGTPDDAPFPTWYGDADHDGHGASTSTQVVCAAPPGFVALGDDCDDGNPLIHPDAHEDCADGDKDCDGSSTDGALDARSWFLDADMDGDGPYASRVIACTSPGAEYVSRGTDCDDANSARNGTAPELRYTGIDEDCNASTLDDDYDTDGLPIANDCDDDNAGVGSPADDTPRFTDVAIASGLIDISASPGPWQSACGHGIQAAGVAVGDYDEDGDLDLFVVGVARPSQLLANDGTGHFTDVTAAAGIDANGPYGGAVFFDLGGDGDLDLFVVAFGPIRSLLFVQDTPGHFVEDAVARGAAQEVANAQDCAGAYSVSAADIDLDGDIDLLVPEWLPANTHSAILLDDGTGHFVKAGAGTGIDVVGRWSFDYAVAEMTGDALPDVLLSGDFGTSAFFSAQTAGTFTNATVAAGVGTDENGMGSALGDYDGDGDLDWFVSSIYAKPALCDDETDLGCTGNRLYRNDGSAHFTDVTEASGVRDGGWGWGSAFFDMDNDGDLDLGHTNGYPFAQYRYDRIKLFVANGATFTEQACENGMMAIGQGRAFVPFDVDRDGDLDVVTTEHGARPILYRNDGDPAHAWLSVRLRDSTSPNRMALGAVVRVRATMGGPVVRREVWANATYAGVGPAEAHFGLGDHLGQIAEVIVRWPDGVETMTTNVSSDQMLTITRTP